MTSEYLDETEFFVKYPFDPNIHLGSGATRLHGWDVENALRREVTLAPAPMDVGPRHGTPSEVELPSHNSRGGEKF